MKKIKSKRHLILIFIGSLIWSLTMVKSGLVYRYGMGFWGPNGHDGIWHIAMIQSLSKGTLQMPIFAGETIKNYHIGFDLLLALVHRITNIPVTALYFQIFPPIFALLIGLLVYKFVLQWRRSTLQAFLATCFVYFSGSFGWVVTLLRNGEIGGESLFWAQQSLSTLVNPPFALSVVVIFIGLICLVRYQKSHTALSLFFTALVFGLLIQIKAYAGLLVLSALFINGIVSFAKNKNPRLFIVFIISSLVSFFAFLPTYNLGTKSFTFQPFWFLESMVASMDRFYWPRMASALANYKLSGNLVKATLAYLLTFVIFFVGNLGIRIAAVPWISMRVKNIKNLDVYEIMIYSMILIGTVLPLLFTQTGNSWNSIQFFYYSLLFFSILIGISVGQYIEKLKSSGVLYSFSLYRVKIFFIMGIIIIFTIPTLFATLRNYLPSRPPAMISNEELDALKFLGKQPSGVVLTLPFDKGLAEKAIPNPPRPLYLYESTAYVSALSGKQTFMEDEVNLDITGYDWRARLSEVINNSNDISYLKSRGIVYVYVPDMRNFMYKNEFAKYIIYNQENIAIYNLR